ncbi:MAG TPA: hypothetical protein VMA32_16755 [Streptosporangiaceae bacterium]|nr:hypothetical protein [Streptosporangiaceae bacterium]
MGAADIWVAKDDGRAVVRAAAITSLDRDYDGNVTVRLSGVEQAAITLVAHPEPTTPEDFHMQLLRMVTQLSDTARPAVVRPVHAEPAGWAWRSDPL